MRKMLQANLSKKLTKGIKSMDFKVRDFASMGVLQNANHHLQDYLQDDEQELHWQHATTLQNVNERPLPGC
jgi:hypothetical protein